VSCRSSPRCSSWQRTSRASPRCECSQLASRVFAATSILVSRTSAGLVTCLMSPPSASRSERGTTILPCTQGSRCTPVDPSRRNCEKAAAVTATTPGSVSRGKRRTVRCS
jgi:hypothetical protein